MRKGIVFVIVLILAVGCVGCQSKPKAPQADTAKLIDEMETTTGLERTLEKGESAGEAFTEEILKEEALFEDIAELEDLLPPEEEQLLPTEEIAAEEEEEGELPDREIRIKLE